MRYANKLSNFGWAWPACLDLPKVCGNKSKIAVALTSCMKKSSSQSVSQSVRMSFRMSVRQSVLSNAGGPIMFYLFCTETVEWGLGTKKLKRRTMFAVSIFDYHRKMQAWEIENRLLVWMERDIKRVLNLFKRNLGCFLYQSLTFKQNKCSQLTRIHIDQSQQKQSKLYS